MQINTTVAEARRWVAALKPSIAARTSLPVLSCIRIDVAGGVAQLLATDLELTTRIRSIPAEGEGSSLIRLVDLQGALKGAKGDVRIEASPQDADHEDEFVIVTTSTGTAVFRPHPVEEFPRQRADEGTPCGSVTAAAAQVAALLTAASNDGARPILTGIHPDVQNQRLAATDSYRLAFMPAEVHGAPGLMPSGFVAHVAKLATGPTVTIDFTEVGHRQEAVCQLGDVEVRSVTIDGEFPPYERLIGNNYATRLSLPADLVPALRSLTGGYGAPVQFTIEDEVLTVTYTVQDVGTRTLLERPAPGYTDGAVAYNPQYLADGMTMCGGDVDLLFNDHLKPAVMSGNGILHLIMPVRTNVAIGAPSHRHDTVDGRRGGYHMPVPVIPEIVEAPVKTKRTGKAELVAFLAAHARHLPEAVKAEADKLLAAA